MKKLKNKFIIWVIILIVLVIVSQIYHSYTSAKVDTNTYVSLIKGKATLNQGFIEVNTQEILSPGDTVRTIGPQSLAIVQWWDGSVTRLWGNTKISVGNNEVTPDYTKINISFELISGKTWSQVVSFITSDSQFTQSFQWIEAGVRGTVFDVDVEKDFVYVSDHSITLTDTNGQDFELLQDTPLHISNFSQIDVWEFLSTLRDADWSALNDELDTKHLQNLATELWESAQSHNPFLFLMEIFSPKYRFIYELDTDQDYDTLVEIIPLLSSSQKADVYDIVLSRYQKLNFVSPSDGEQYTEKLLYKRLLITLSPSEQDKERLVETSLYDFKDAINLQDIPAFTQTLGLLEENKDIIQQIDTSAIIGNIDLLPDDLEQIFLQNLSDIGGFLKWGIPDTSSINIETGKQALDTVTEWFSDTKDKAQQGIEKWLDSLYDSFAN